MGKLLSKSSINAGIAAIKSFFKWFTLTYPEIIATNPTLGVKLEKIPLPAPLLSLLSISAFFRLFLKIILLIIRLLAPEN